METLKAMIAGMRPSHWIKNIFIFAAIPFGGKFFSLPAWMEACAVALVFCFLASSIYLVNDVSDRHTDRLHPEKRKRAVASGRLPVTLAIWESIVLGLISLGAAILLDLGAGRGFPGLSLCSGGYLLVNLLYSLGLKQFPVLDIILVAAGFVIRVVAGALAIGVPASPWLVMCTFMLALFLSTAKRRSEILESPAEIALRIRNVNAFYTRERLEHMLSVAASLAIMSYSLYAVSPQTVERTGSSNMVWTIPMVVYGIFRFYCLSGQAENGDTFRILFRDRGMWGVGMVWLVVVLGILYTGAGHR